MLTRYYEMHVTKKRALWLGILVIGGMNIALLLLETALLHGSAFGGMIRGGHYYVGEKAKFTEVPFFLFRLNQLHTIFVLITAPILVFAAYQFRSFGKEVEDYSPVTSRDI
jgi:hypothetical protein